MNIEEIKYNLPEDLIASYPLKKRDEAKLMVVDRKNQSISHDKFYNLAKYLPEDSVIVMNDSKVIPARLLGKRQKTKGEVEIFLLNKLADGYSYEVLMRPLRRLKVNEVVYFKEGVAAQIKDKERKIVRFNRKNLDKYLNRIGHMPLPPYIKRQDKAVDRRYYQTVYAKKNGSVASPTAGLHFTTKLLDSLKRAGHKIYKVTLHINYATFKPVEEADITQHKMHFEKYLLSQKTKDAILKDKTQGKKVVAVGTTSCRVLETVVQNSELTGDTNLFIYPGYQFKLTDILITNFHLPLSTLLLLVYAFGGTELMQKAYQEAIKNKYRFYSYGDAMVII